MKLAVCCAAGLLVCTASAQAEISALPPDVVAAIAQMGPHLTPEIIGKTNALIRPLVPPPPASVKITNDISYGDDPLQRLDIDRPAEGSNLPIAVYVHGGAFVVGNKSDYSNIVSYFAQHGVVGVNVNYRLAPKVTWPAESEDVGAAIAFIRKNGAQYGGDPNRIVLIGHSAGANLVASYVLDPSLHPEDGPGVAAAVVISLPAYRAASIHDQDHVYFGNDPSLYEKRAPAAYVNTSKTPLMIAMTEFDPIELAPESYYLAQEVCVRDGKCARFLYVTGHNHISEVASIGSKDDQLARPLLEFVKAAR